MAAVLQRTAGLEEASARIERKLDVNDENTRRVATAVAAHTGQPVRLLARSAIVAPDTMDQ